MAKSKVYFIKDTGSKSLVRLYEKLGKELKGNVAVKLHSGERGNQNYLRPEFVKPIIDHVNGTVVECNTAYGHDMGGHRFNTESHMKVMKEHGWSENFDIDILDSEGPDLVLEVPKGNILKENFVGKDLSKYNSLLVLSHFKGHPMGGYGGALKQLSIGCASSAGKCWIHSTGQSTDIKDAWEKEIDHDEFLEAMAEAAETVHDYFKDNVVYINALVNLSVDCDCCHVAEDPCMKDIGIMISTDPVAIDQACIDMVYNSKDPGRDHFVERVESRNGRHTIDTAAKLGYGSKEYELIDIDEEN
ncbi:DUF362 domain-containing protein [Dubosiella newyorkensis]|uniref:DUF362 domain-containing protein n=1 Tax=Dubosiella newyorkensis TaxID=1862672 RepID=UPI00248BA82A|nr:DUF362 domain-containing protein [Dubosiella newyorkensis]